MLCEHAHLDIEWNTKQGESYLRSHHIIDLLGGCRIDSWSRLLLGSGASRRGLTSVAALVRARALVDRRTVALAMLLVRERILQRPRRGSRPCQARRRGTMGSWGSAGCQVRGQAVA